jgi:hypothetical protein
MSEPIAGEEQPLPQPKGDNNNNEENRAAPLYRYLLYEDAEAIHFPGGVLHPETLVWVLLSKGKKKVPKLHERARVVTGEPDEEGRVLVRYPSGSTYRVRRKNLVPVPGQLTHTIIVASETNDYRRMSIVHTRKEDHFIGE